MTEVLHESKRESTDFRVQETNPAFVDMTGLVNAIGRTVREIAPAYVPLCLETLDKLASSQEPVRFECHATEVDRWFEVYAFKLSDAEGCRLAMSLKDIGSRKRSEEALRRAADTDSFRLSLSDTLRELNDPLELQSACCALLAQYLGVDLAAYCEVSDAGELIVAAEHLADADALPRSLPLPEVFGEERLQDLSAGRPVLESDALSAARQPPQKLGARLLGLRAYLAVPLLRGGRLAGVLLVNQNAPRQWTDADVTITQEAAERTWTAVERARAERAMRKSAAALREADSRKDEFLAMLSHELRNL